MPGTNGSRGYVGGIAAMVAHNDVCGSCGKIHAGRPFGFRLNNGLSCPELVVGVFPVLAGGSESAAAPSAVGPTGFEPIYPSNELEARTPSRRVSALPVPWPMPTQIEEYL